MSETSLNEEKSMKQKLAIPFITFDSKLKKFTITPEAKKIINKVSNSKIGIVSLVGKYRTGKSFLLNKVLITNSLNEQNEKTENQVNNNSSENTEKKNNIEEENDNIENNNKENNINLENKDNIKNKEDNTNNNNNNNDNVNDNNDNNNENNDNNNKIKNYNINNEGFDVGPTIRPCTKGIWLWSKPIMISNNHSKDKFPAFLIDTEGLGAYDEEVNHDTKIFLISILISSLFIYNSFGTIDENALNNLSLILNISKSLKLRNNNNNNINEEEEMSKYFPSFLWLLRDFALKLEDNEGNVITAKQYLENALNEQKGSSDTIIEKNQVRKLIKTYFHERDCFPMVRPVENENDLQNLMFLPKEKIRPEFITQSQILRNKILMKIKPKNFNGKILSGPMLIDLVENVINCINEGAIPIIENSWKYIINNECLKSINLIVNEYKNKIIKFQKDNLNSNNFFSELEQFNQNLIKDLIKKFQDENNAKFDDISDYIKKLKINLNQEFKKLNEENVSLLQNKYSNDLERGINELMNDKEKISKENYITFFSELLQIKDKVDNLIPEFNLKQQISFDKIISSIKKYIEEYYESPKKELEKKVQNLTNEKEIIDSRLLNLNEEYKKDKDEFKQTVDKYNDMLIEYKIKDKAQEKKIKNFELEKKTLKETNEMTLSSLTKQNEAKIEKLTLEIDKLNNELKTKDEEILLIKLNDEKVSALNIQKITFLEKELEQWKERYNIQTKEFSEAKSQIINLTAECDKAKGDIKSLENKLLLSNNPILSNRSYNQSSIKGNSLNNSYFLRSHTMSNNFTNGNINLILRNQNDIKDELNQLIEDASKLIDNKDLLLNQNNNNNNNSNINISDNIINISNTSGRNKKNKNLNINDDNEEFSFPPKSQKFSLTQGNINNNQNLSNTYSSFNSKSKSNSKSNSNSNSKTNISSSRGNKKNNIKIINALKKNDIFEYTCEIKKGEITWKLNKTLNQFMLFNKAINNLFKGLIIIPNPPQNLFHNENENKINELNDYIEQLSQNEIISHSVPYRNFFEIDEHSLIKKTSPSPRNIDEDPKKSQKIIEKKNIGKKLMMNIPKRNYNPSSAFSKK